MSHTVNGQIPAPKSINVQQAKLADKTLSSYFHHTSWQLQ